MVKIVNLETYNSPRSDRVENIPVGKYSISLDSSLLKAHETLAVDVFGLELFQKIT